MASRSGEGSLPENSPASSSVASFAALWLALSAAGAGLLTSFVEVGWLWPGTAAEVGLAWSAGLALVIAGWRQRRQIGELRQLIAEGRREARALRQERDRAADTSASKTRLFAAASHDLRQPLHALSINATTLQLVAGRQDNSVIRDLSVSINRALLRSNGLLDSLLDMSRFDAQAIPVQIECVSAPALLEAVREQFAPSAAERGIELKVIPPPPEAAKLELQVDVTLMSRVLGNLVSNAIKFTERGGVILAAWAEEPAQGAESDVLIEVRDTGRGIEAADLPRIFEEFYQVDPSQRDVDGSLGLGLSIVRRATDLMGIEVQVASQPGEGTTVSLRCPGGESRRRRAEGLKAHPTDTETGAGGDWLDPSLPGFGDFARSETPVRALLVEDEREIRGSLENLLPRIGFEIRSASGLGEALAIVDAGYRPTILVIDELLRGERGLMVAQALQKRLGAVPVLVVTGDTRERTRRELEAAGLAVIYKPLDGWRLARHISNAKDYMNPTAARASRWEPR